MASKQVAVLVLGLAAAALAAPVATTDEAAAFLDVSARARRDPPPLLQAPASAPKFAPRAVVELPPVAAHHEAAEPTAVFSSWDTSSQAYQIFKEHTLLVAVVSAPSHFKARETIRQTWGSMLDKLNFLTDDEKRGTDLVFVIGEVLCPNTTDSACDHAAADVLEGQLRTEGNRHGDLVRVPVHEAYTNLSRKVVSTLDFANARGYSFLLKCDDDSFVRLDNLVAWIKTHPSPEYLYAGHFNWGASVVSNPASKWFLSDQYNATTLPPYADGPAYLLGPKTLQYLANKRSSLVVYRVEDAGMGIWLADAPVLRDDFNVISSVASCWDPPDLIFVNPVNTAEMEKLMTNIKQGDMCKGWDGAAFSMQFCASFPCLCSPPPPSCTGVNWDAHTNSDYVDLIPRL